MPNGGMESAQMVAGHGVVHVMFNVIVHVPIEKTDQGVHQDRSRAKTKVEYGVGQTCVLCIVAKETEPLPVKNPERRQHGNYPKSHSKGGHDDGSVTQKHKACPADKRSSLVAL